MSNDITGGLRNLKGGSIDALRGPYPTVAAANTAIPSTVVDGINFREGKFVEVGVKPNLVTYWWNGGYENTNLVPAQRAEYWIPQAYGRLSQAAHKGVIWEAVKTTTAAQEPGVASTDWWIKVVGNPLNTILDPTSNNTTTTDKAAYDSFTKERFLVTGSSPYGVNQQLNEQLNTAILKLCLNGNWKSSLLVLGSLTFTSGVLTFYLHKATSETEVITANVGLIAKGEIATIALTGVVRVNLVQQNNSNISGYVEIDFSNYNLASNQLNYSSTATYKSRGVKSSKIIDITPIYDGIINSNVEGDLNFDILRSSIRSLTLNKAYTGYIFISMFTLNSDTGVITIRISRYNNADSISALVPPVGEEGSGAWGYILTGTGNVSSADQAGILRIALTTLNTSGYSGEILLDLNRFYKGSSGKKDIIGTNFNLSYRTSGVLQQRVSIVSDLVVKPDFLVNSNVDNTDFNILKKSLKKVTINSDYSGYLFVSEYKVNAGGLVTVTLSRYNLPDSISSLVPPSGEEGSPAWGFVCRGAVYRTEVDGAGFLRVPLLALSNSGLTGEALIDMSEYYQTNNNSRLTPATYQLSYRTSGLIRYKVNLSTINGVPLFDSLFSAVRVKQKGAFWVNKSAFRCISENPVSKSDYETISGNPYPVVKNLNSTFSIYFNKEKCKICHVSENDEFYLVSENYIVKSLNYSKVNKTTISAVEFSSGVNQLDTLKDGVYSRIFFPDFTVLFDRRISFDFDVMEGLTPLNDTDFFVFGRKDGGGRIYITKNNGTALRSFSVNSVSDNKFSLGNGARFVEEWSFTSFGNIVAFSDYDIGVVNGVYPYAERGTTGGQKCYISIDGGYTFVTKFTAGIWANITNKEDITDWFKPQFHIHSIQYDPFWKRLWLISGDGFTYKDNSSFWWSDDLGATWTHKRCKIEDNTRVVQMVNTIPLKDNVLFGSDSAYLSGVSRYNRNSNKNLVSHEFAFENQSGGVRTEVYGRGWVKKNENQPLFWVFGKDPTIGATDLNIKSFLLATWDGCNFHKIWEDSTGYAFGTLSVFADKEGNIYIMLDGPNFPLYREIIFVEKINWVG